jgi:hypothetical protein
LPERSNTTLSDKKGVTIVFQNSVFLTALQDSWENGKENIFTTKPDAKKLKIKAFLSIQPKC